MSQVASRTSGTDHRRERILAGRYRLDGFLGRGGMATVHRAHDLVLDRDVAVKLFPSAADEADVLLRHSAETQILARMNHPGLVLLYDAGREVDADGLHEVYLVLELVDGPTLADRLRSGPLDIAATARVGVQVAEALAAVHEQGVIHRDIKPANMLMTTGDRDQVVKVADFGIARLADATRLTMTGVTLGTVRYLSPEQVCGGALTPATDVYSLGLVLIECLSGRSVFAGTLAESAAARLTSSPAIPDGLPDDVADLLSRMTARDPDDRPTAAAVAAELARVARGPGAAGPGPADDPTEVVELAPTAAAPTLGAHDPSEARPTRRRWVVPALGAVAALAVCAVALPQMGGASSPRPTPSHVSGVVAGEREGASTATQGSKVVAPSAASIGSTKAAATNAPTVSKSAPTSKSSDVSKKGASSNSRKASKVPASTPAGAGAPAASGKSAKAKAADKGGPAHAPGVKKGR